MASRLSDYQLVTGELVAYRRRRGGLWEDVPLYLAFPMPPAGGRRLLTLDGQDAGYVPGEVWDAMRALPHIRVSPGLPWTDEDETEARGERLGIRAV